MAILGENLDYSDKDFDSLRARLINLIQSAFPEWTDFNVANFGNILMELTAFVGDVLVFYQDNQSGESRIATAQLRRTMLALVKLIGFQVEGAGAATTELTFSLTEIPTGDVTVKAGDRFRTLEITDPVTFQALADAIMVAGADPPTIIFTVEHSENSTQVFNSTGLPNQSFELSDTPFLDGSLDTGIVAANGVYTIVPDFLDSTSTDRHAVVTVDENDRARVDFGNDINGQIPQGTITFSYKTGGGDIGNVNPGTLRRAENSYSDEFGDPVTVVVTNDEKATGGTPRQSVEDIRVEAPRSLRVLNRTVAREDFEINALKVTGIARALMLTSNERPSIDENTGQLFLVADGIGAPSQALIDEVLNQVRVVFPHTLTFVVDAFSAEFLTIDIQSTVFLQEGTTPATADATIRANLAAFFALDNPDGTPNANAQFGFETSNEVALSNIRNVIRNSAGVRKLDDTFGTTLINGVSADLFVDNFQFPVLGTIVLLDGDTGDLLVSAT